MNKLFLKKYWIYFCLIVTFITNMVLIKPVQASEFKKDDVSIKVISQSYFERYFKALKSSKDANYDDIIYNSDLKHYLNKNLKFDIILNNKLKRTIKDIEYNIKYNTIDVNSNECIVDLDLNINKTYIEDDNSQTFTDEDIENHILLLKNKDNQWTIENDVYDPLTKTNKSFLKDSSYNKDRINAVEESILNINNRVKLIKSLKNNVITRSKRSTQRYDRNKAVNYAKEHAHSYNPVYGDFTANGGDCTNFVSQCLAKGHIPHSRSGGWWFTNENDYGLNWIRVEGLHDYLTSYNFAESYEYSLGVGFQNETMSNITYWGKPGDVLQLRFLGKSRYGHSIIITGFSSNKGDLYYCVHTNNVNGGSFRKKVLEKSLFSKVRLIHITY